MSKCGYLRVPDDLGTETKYNVEESFFEENAGFDPKLAQNAHKMGRNGVHWGVYRGPRPFGRRKYAERNFGKQGWPILAQKDVEKFPALAKIK